MVDKLLELLGYNLYEDLLLGLIDSILTLSLSFNDRFYVCAAFLYPSLERRTPRSLGKFFFVGFFFFWSAIKGRKLENIRSVSAKKK